MTLICFQDNSYFIVSLIVFWKTLGQSLKYFVFLSVLQTFVGVLHLSSY